MRIVFRQNLKKGNSFSEEKSTDCLVTQTGEGPVEMEDGESGPQSALLVPKLPLQPE